jgi:CLIP-associating protein 1/2
MASKSGDLIFSLLQAKVAVLNYLHGLVLAMDPGDFQNTSETRIGVSRIITWTTEPKSVDVRKAAQAVVIALFNLNTAEFSMVLSGLPKPFQVSGVHLVVIQNKTRFSYRMVPQGS